MGIGMGDLRFLTWEQVEHFLERGFVVLRDCFPRALAEEWVAEASRGSGTGLKTRQRGPSRGCTCRRGDYSPVEQAVLRGLGVASFEFNATGPRERLVPARVRSQRRMTRAEKGRGRPGGPGVRSR